MRLIAYHVNLRFLKVHFSVLIQFLVVHITSNPKKLSYTNFSSIVRRDNILKVAYISFVIITQVLYI